MQVLVVTSIFAAFLAFQANTSRYHFALARDAAPRDVELARDGLLPRWIAWTYPKSDAPLGGSAVQLALTAIVTIVLALAHRTRI